MSGELSLADEAALVTGASSGIGSTCALALARAGAICPDINRTAWAIEAALADFLRLIRYGRIGNVQDVARPVIWLCSNQADHVIGATLVVGGDMLLYPGFQKGHG